MKIVVINRAVDICDLVLVYICAFVPYQSGKPISELVCELGFNSDGIIKLVSNENPFGVSSLVMQAMQQAFVDIVCYPDGNGFELKYVLL